MSLENHGVFQLMKDVTFRRILAFLQLMKMGPFSWCLVTLLQPSFQATLLYKEQARYEEAERLLLEALEGRRLKLGEQHPHTMDSLNQIIDLYEAWANDLKKL